MGFWKFSGGNAYFANLKWLKKDDDSGVRFEITKDWEVVQDDASYISGYFSKIELGSFEYEWRDIEKFTMTLVDPKDWSRIIRSSSFNVVSRSVINSLASQESLWLIQISVYTNRSGFPSAYVENHWERAEWLLSWDQQKELIDPVKDKKGEVVKNDYSELDDKLKKLMENFVPDEGNVLKTPDPDDVDNDKLFDPDENKKPVDDDLEDLPF